MLRGWARAFQVSTEDAAPRLRRFDGARSAGAWRGAWRSYADLERELRPAPAKDPRTAW